VAVVAQETGLLAAAQVVFVLEPLLLLFPALRMLLLWVQAEWVILLLLQIQMAVFLRFFL